MEPLKLQWFKLALFCALMVYMPVTMSDELNDENTEISQDYFHPGRVYYIQPEQIHLSYWGDPTQMWVTWVSLDNGTLDGKPVQSNVQYGQKGFTQSVTGNMTYFIDAGAEKRHIFVHRALMTDLLPDSRFMYRVGGHRTGWSAVMFFRSFPYGTKWSPRFAVFGDLGNSYGMSIGPLQTEAALGHLDAVLHYGDFAYDLAQDNGRFGDQFMRQMQPVAGYVPYMTTPGNHEYHYNFLNYKNRFTMPRNGYDKEMPNMFYSVNIGPVHIIAVCTEFLYYTGFGWAQNWKQYEWLVADLKKATRPENLRKQPWIVVMGHRPPYCSDNDDGEMCNLHNLVREGFPGVKAYGFENLLYQYGVDLAFWAHEHSYERTFPVYNLTVMNGTGSDAYNDPGATVHIINGCAGNREKHDGFFKNPWKWSAVRSEDFGYGRMVVFNTTHLYFEQISAEKGTIVDRLWITKSLHGPAAFKKWKKLHSKKYGA